MRQNLGFAFIYNAIGVPIAAGVLVHWRPEQTRYLAILILQSS